MNIRKILFVLAILLSIVITVVLLIDITKKYDTKFSYDYDVSTPPKLLVYKIGDQEHEQDTAKITQTNPVTTITQNSTIKLSPGSYIGIINDPAYQEQELEFRVEQETEVIIPVNLSEDRLNKQLDQERPNIVASIRSGTIIPPDYIIGPGKLIKNGDWYVTTIIKDTSVSSDRIEFEDTYRVVARKSNGKWALATPKPELLLSTKKNPNIPKEVLDQANNL